MKKGAFALIDCLGFKGIWKRIENPQILIEKLIKIEEIVQKKFDSESETFELMGIKFPAKFINIRLLSDTVAISLLDSESEDMTTREMFSNIFMNFFVIDIMDHFLKDEPHLVMRGCISYGEHISQGNFILGPAIDEAAEYMDIANGAFVWMLPSASKKYTENIDIIINKSLTRINFPNNKPDQIHTQEHYNLLQVFYSGTVVQDYEMPIKGGGHLKCPVLNPLINHKTKEECQEVIEAYSQTMNGDKLDIWTKKQHTMKFLELANENFDNFRKVTDSLSKRGF